MLEHRFCPMSIPSLFVQTFVKTNVSHLRFYNDIPTNLLFAFVKNRNRADSHFAAQSSTRIAIVTSKERKIRRRCIPSYYIHLHLCIHSVHLNYCQAVAEMIRLHDCRRIPDFPIAAGRGTEDTSSHLRWGRRGGSQNY